MQDKILKIKDMIQRRRQREQVHKTLEERRLQAIKETENQKRETRISKVRQKIHQTKKNIYHTAEKQFFEKNPKLSPSEFQTKRIGLWCHSSTFYSGGRIHMWQYLLASARNGMEVYLITDNYPIWLQDYNKPKNVHIITNQTPIPKDIDIVVTDGKENCNGAFLYKKAHPNIPLICFVFETPNWVKENLPGEASRMTMKKEKIEQADLFICPSQNTVDKLKEWLCKDIDAYVLPPAINTDAIDNLSEAIDLPTDRKYFVWIGRASKYKGCYEAQQSVWDIKEECDLVIIGQKPRTKIQDTANHKLIHKENISDIEKFSILKNASGVLCTSKFEGFGMVPSESLAVGTPVLARDLPVYKANYKDKLIYTSDFAQSAKTLLRKNKRVDTQITKEVIDSFGLSAMQKSINNIPFHITKGYKVTAQMIALFGPVVQQSLKSIYPYVDEIVIAYGPTELWKDKPVVECLDLIRSFPDPENKIKLEVRKLWKDKQEMRSWCGANTTGNYVMLVDADEIWDGVDRWLEVLPLTGAPKWVHFWHNKDFQIVGGRRGKELGDKGIVGNHYRWSFWKPSFYYPVHSSPRTAFGKYIHSQKKSLDAILLCSNTIIYHLGHALDPNLMYEKHQFYINRDGNDNLRQQRLTSWHGWNGEEGEWEEGTIKRISWELPEIVKEAFDVLGA